jgi:hypothetical protein
VIQNEVVYADTLFSNHVQLYVSTNNKPSKYPPAHSRLTNHPPIRHSVHLFLLGFSGYFTFCFSTFVFNLTENQPCKLYLPPAHYASHILPLYSLSCTFRSFYVPHFYSLPLSSWFHILLTSNDFRLSGPIEFDKVNRTWQYQTSRTIKHHKEVHSFCFNNASTERKKDEIVTKKWKKTH